MLIWRLSPKLTELRASRTISSHSSASSDSTTPLSPDHPLTQASPTPTPTQVLFHHRTARMAVRTQLTVSPGMSARIAKAAALSLSSFYKRYISSYETPSPSLSLTLIVRKRYRGTYELIKDTEGESSKPDSKRDGSEDESLDSDYERERVMGQGLEDEGLGMQEEEEAALEGQYQAVLIVNTAASKPLGHGYRAARCRTLESTEEIVPSTYEVGQSSRSVLEMEGAERIYAFRHPTLVTWVDHKDGRVYTDISTYVPLAAPVQAPPSPEWSLALKVWEGQTNSQRAALWHAIYDIQRENHDLRRQIAKERENHDLRRQIAEERYERLELTYRVVRIEMRHDSRGD
uniref:Uncharacterized protein n=1 Tax=Tanacetum cinerariifolium TaxID=118510 RepID=A0A6L2LCY1_TANCI|nr:hypothetical protein [Tanacetum cinerariifolium]